jgi:2-isopropylmalate synthase
MVEIECQGGTFHGKGVSTDIIEASALAYLQALNKASAANGGGRKQHPQHGV